MHISFFTLNEAFWRFASPLRPFHWCQCFFHVDWRNFVQTFGEKLFESQVCFLFSQQHEYKPYPTQANMDSIPLGMGQSTVTRPAVALPPPPSEPSADDFKNFDIVRATQFGAYERCVELVENGFDVNQPDRENVCVLHWAAINNRQDIVRSDSFCKNL